MKNILLHRMNNTYENLHQEMLEEINESKELEMPEEERAAVGFWIANTYWGKLKIIACPTSWKRKSEEIDFFRNVKPKFTAYIQYFTIIAEALLFVPERKEDRVTYWQEEMKRYDFFRDKHPEFTRYYESGNRDMDKQYFTKAPKDWQNISPMMTYDSDKTYCSTHDWLVRGLLAHRMYYEYAGKKRNEL
jgi:hypothetical protein